jgi:hypothetical protein
VDIFEVRERLIGDYREFTSSFVDVRDTRIKEHIRKLTDIGQQWPDPWLSLNPNFASGGSVSDLVAKGLLDPECERIFRIKRDASDPGSQPLRLHKHQAEAIPIARRGESYMLTTGTGSGKSLAYLDRARCGEELPARPRRRPRGERRLIVGVARRGRWRTVGKRSGRCSVGTRNCTWTRPSGGSTAGSPVSRSGQRGADLVEAPGGADRDRAERRWAGRGGGGVIGLRDPPTSG